MLRAREVMTPEIRWETTMDGQFTPVVDILTELTSTARVQEWKYSRQLKLVPTGLLQGRTFNNALIIIDEAQNMDIPAMRMAITRMGERSRVIVTGDPSQTLLRTHEPSGLPHLLNLLEGSDLALVHRFTEKDIVRNPTVAKLERLYSSKAAA